MEAELKEILKIDKSSWTPVEFGDVAFEPKENAKDIYNEGIEHVVGLEHIDSENIHLTRSGKLEESTTFSKKFKRGDVLFGRRRAYLKKAALANFNGICSGDITVFRAKQKLIPKLLPFVVSNEKFFDHAIKHSAGGLSPRVKFKDLANYKFLLPPKDQQVQLSELLWAMDEVMESYRSRLSSFERLKGALQRKHLEVSMEDLVEISSIGKVFSGGTPDRKRPEYWNGSIPWAKTGEVNYNVITETEENISQLGLENSAAKVARPNSVVVAMYGEGVTRGRVAITEIPLTTNQACAIIELLDGYLSKYLYYFLEYKYEALRSLAHGANQQNLNLNMIKSFCVPKFSIEIQSAVVIELSQIETTNSLCLATLQQAKQLQKSLINQIF
ncbi:MAG: restriction endonuclease subunit S [Cyclobacteriaceae bacterium]|nr:restriction endonuclease subunit S [Cyclobacteriaceae bacterium]